MKVGNLEIIGTSHIANESVEAVKRSIETKRPDVVAIELDSRRAHALFHSREGRPSLKLMRVVGVKGFVFLVIAGFLQKKLGRIVGVQPGSEMKTALKAAIGVNSKIALIDRDLEITMRRLSQTLSWKERLRFLVGIFSGFFAEDAKEFRSIDLRRVPSKRLIAKVMGKLKRHYPNLYRVLVEERNEHMAAALVDIINKNPGKRILAVVGAGHEDELALLVKDKLKTATSYSFSFG